MNITNLKPANGYRVSLWLTENIKDLTPLQKQQIINETFVFHHFYFFEKRAKTNNVLLRFSIVLLLPVWCILIICLPFNFFITGYWGYNYYKIKWFNNWVSNCGLL